MNFSSLVFIFVFLPVLFLLFYLVPKKFKYLILLLGSIVFYSYSGLFNLIVLLCVSTFNYFITRIFGGKKKFNLILVVLALLNIFTLLLFKYNKNLLFPLGISFYIFNNVSYIIDVKRKKIKPEKNYLYYLLYSMLFCHVTMGPIIRYENISKDLKRLDYSFDDVTSGFRRFLNGLFKKVLFADSFGLLYATLIGVSEKSSLLIIMSLVVFGLQLYLDFSGYCGMAIGLGKMIGVKYPENFDYPYMSLSISEFWRRWHITLSDFFKEYIYFPMGGNRVSKLRNIFNLLVVWFLTGIWHGNSWNFLLWGIYYGIIIILEKYILKKLLEKMPKIIRHIYVLLIVLIGYIFFSFNSMESISNVFKILFTGQFINSTVVFYLKENLLYIIIGCLLCCKIPKVINDFIRNKKVFNVIIFCGYIILLLITISYILSGSYQPFLYNNF